MFAEAQDLSFKPVETHAPRRLGSDDIARYNAEGFCQPFQIYGAEEVGEIRAYVDGLMSAMGDAGSYGINCYQARLSGIYDIATDPRILDHVEDIIGPDILCWATAILSKNPRIRRTCPGIRMRASGSSIRRGR